jgi:transposase
LTTKIHAVVDALGSPLRFILSPGQASDYTYAHALIDKLPADDVLGDKGYDSKAFRDAIVKQGAVAVIDTPKDIATGCLRLRPILRTQSRGGLLPENQTLQKTCNALRTDLKSLHVHACNRQRFHLGKMNVNAI